MEISDQQLVQLRRETPGCENVLHFNNAGSSLMPNSVFEATRDHLQLERDIGGYEAEAKSQNLLDNFYDAFATLLNSKPSEIAYVENATRAWDMAFYSLPLNAGDQVITHESEYVSNYLAFLQLAERRGIEIVRAPSDNSGQIDVDGLRKCITGRTRLIALTHVPTQGGLVNPAEEVGKVAREEGLIYLLDACQSVGQMDLDVERIGCDLLSGTGRKFLRGPRGTGFLYVSGTITDKLNPPFIDLHAAKWTSADSYAFVEGAKRFENFESYVAGRIGLANAVNYALKIGLHPIELRVTALAHRLREQLSEIKGIAIADQGERKCGIVTFTKDGKGAEKICSELSSRNINVSVSVRGHARLDLEKRGISSLVRASVHYFNTGCEIDDFCEAIAAAD